MLTNSDSKNNNKKVKVRLPLNGNIELDVVENTTALEVLGRIKKLFPNIKLPKNIVACALNNESHSLTHPIDENCDFTFVQFSDLDGRRILDRTIKYVFLMAAYEVYPNMRITLEHKIGRECFCKIAGEELTEEKLNDIKTKMIEIVKANLPIIKKKVSFRKLKDIYKKMQLTDLLDNYQIKLIDNYTVYECLSYNNFLYGFMTPSTGYIKAFNLRMYKKDMCILTLTDRNNICKATINHENEKTYEYFTKDRNISDILGIKNVADLNTLVLDNEIRDVIRLSEQQYDRQLIEIAKEIVNKPQDVKIVLLTGPSSSGKTTTAQKLCDQLKLESKIPHKISMDNYFKDENEEENPDFESVTHISIELFESHMLKLLEGEEVSLPTYDFVKREKVYNGNKLKLGKNDILVIEGIHALNPIVSKCLPQDRLYKIYIAPLVSIGFDQYTKVSSNDTRLLRRIVRDYQTRGRSAEGTILQWPSVREGEEKNIHPFVDAADIVVNTNLIYEIGVLKVLAANLLLCIKDDSPVYSEARRLYSMLENFRDIETKYIPTTSLITEFIGGGCFDR